MEHFADRLFAAVEAKRSHVVVGLDPDYDLLPPAVRGAPEEVAPDDLEGMAGLYRVFLGGILDAVAEVAVAVKPQLAYFEALGSPGYRLYEELVGEAKERGLLVIADAKRGDIGSTAEAYARAHLDLAGADSMTVNPWFGSDGMEPFLRRAREEGRGLFVLVKTSNRSSAEIQDLPLAEGGPAYGRVAELVEEWGAAALGERGYSSVGAVVGGTHPAQAAALRAAHPEMPFLVPGYGAQGATAADLAGAFDAAGSGAVVNSSRGILYAYRSVGGDWRSAARSAAEEMRSELWSAARGRGSV